MPEKKHNLFTVLDDILSGKTDTSARYGNFYEALGLKEPALTKEEKAYVQYSQDRLNDGSAIQNEDGSISTVRGTIVNIDGKERLIPTVWDGKILETEDAVKRVKESGMKFPVYSTPEQARGREVLMKEHFINKQVPEYAPKTR